MNIASYPTDLTDAQWAIIEPMLPAAAQRGRPRTDPRLVFNAILYVAKAGCPWRLLPTTFPPWQTVFHVFRRWALDHVFRSINDRLRDLVRTKTGKFCQPTACVLDSQSVKSDPHGGEVGYDAAKKIKGRKRHLLVDTLGLILGIKATPASATERDGAELMLKETLPWFQQLKKMWVDGGYSGPEFAGKVGEMRPGLEVEVVKRSDDVKGFKVLPWRWVVERTFGWLMRHRRLARDYETTESSAEAWCLTAMIRVQIRRLA